MKDAEQQHEFTLNGFYCVLCGATYSSGWPCEPDKVPDYEAGRH